MRKKRIVFIAALMVITGLCLLIAIGLHMVYKGSVQLPSLPLPLANLDVKADSVLYTHTEENGRRWILEATSVQYDRSSREALLSQVKVTFYQDDEEILSLTANEGKLDADHNTMTVLGDVVVKSAPDTILLTESLVYVSKKGLVTTTDPVDLRTIHMRITGIGMTMDLNSRRVIIHSSVQSWMREV